MLLLLPLLRWLPWLRLLHWSQSHLSGLSDLLDLSLRWLLPLLQRQSLPWLRLRLRLRPFLLLRWLPWLRPLRWLRLDQLLLLDLLDLLGLSGLWLPSDLRFRLHLWRQ